MSPHHPLRTASLLLLALGAFALSSPGFSSPDRAATSPSHPRVSISPPLHDLGQISQQQLCEVSFRVHNHGTSRLVLNERDRGCPCEDHPRRILCILPGQTAHIATRLDTRFTTGPVESITTFTCNDPTTPHIRLVTRATVAPPPPH